jgi:hypothetical protein
LPSALDWEAMVAIESQDQTDRKYFIDPYIHNVVVARQSYGHVEVT